MITVTVTHRGRTAVLEYDDPPLLSQALRDADADLAMPCGGGGRCGKCRVLAGGALSPVGEEEARLLGSLVKQHTRLACMTRALGDAWAQTLERREQEIATDIALPPLTPDGGDGWGLAIDIGTTTVAAYAFRLDSVTPAAVASEANPQASYGADVISRLEKSLAGEGPALARTIRDCLGRLEATLCREAGILPRDLSSAVIVGNTAMMFLLLGEEVSSLAAAPFCQSRSFGEWVEPSAVGLTLAPGGRCRLPRVISAFVGADITAALLAARLEEGSSPALLVDVGTNGEMALFHDGGLLCCSTAAGPAFEGAGISQGMNASPGAIRRVRLEGDRLRCETVGDAPPLGVCGSGLIDAVAALLEAGALDETGLLQEEDHPLLPLTARRDGEPAIRLDGDVWLTQRDIRAVQLAKAALRAGIETLLHQAGLTPDDVVRLEIAGGFGGAIDVESAESIGLLPPGFGDRAHAMGNGAGAGAAAILLSQSQWERSLALAGAARTAELSSSPFFSQSYVESMLFPEKTEGKGPKS